MKTYWFYFNNRIVGHGRGMNPKDAYQDAIKAAEMLNRDDLPYLVNGCFGTLTCKTFS